MSECNRRLYRSEILLGFLQEPAEAEPFKVIADALDAELQMAVKALEGEICSNYQLSGNRLEHLTRFNADMVESRLLTQLYEQPDSWLFQIRSQAFGQQDKTQVIGSDRVQIKRDRKFYIQAVADLQRLTETLRQQGLSE